MSLNSPAYGVPPEPPLKRQKVAGSVWSESKTMTTQTVAPMADLSEQLDMQERKKYSKGKTLGRGTYADVFLATLKSDPSKTFAIKKIRIAAEQDRIGISYDTLREIR
ncbi:TFIIH complex serine/threonine-protein kinase subunit kin28, partial [Oleoguttula sp. CCFEE 5521]